MDVTKQDVGQTISPALGHNSHLSRWEERLFLFFLPAGWDIVLNNSTSALTPPIGLRSRPPLVPSRLKDSPEELFLSVANCDLAKSLFCFVFFAFWAFLFFCPRLILEPSRRLVVFITVELRRRH